MRSWFDALRRRLGGASPGPVVMAPPVREVAFAIVTREPDRFRALQAPGVRLVAEPQRADTEWLVFAPSSLDVLPSALPWLAHGIAGTPDADVVFGDDVASDGAPFHKPGWSDLLLLSHARCLGVFAVRRELVLAALEAPVATASDPETYDPETLDPEAFDPEAFDPEPFDPETFDPDDEASLHALGLRVTFDERTRRSRRVVHVPELLGAWRRPLGDSVAHRREVAAAARRRGLVATVTATPVPAVYALGVRAAAPRSVTVVVPTRDRRDLFEPCLDSVLAHPGPHDVQVLVVDNGSCEADSLQRLADYVATGRVRVLRDDRPFDYAALMNAAVAAATTEFVVLLNNDTAVIAPDWLDQMLGWLELPDVGAVGAKLYHGDDTIQHAGVVLGIGGVASHGHKNARRDAPGYHGLLHCVRDVSAVTAACLVTRRQHYLAVGGMTSDLRVAYNDIDFCLKLRERGLRVVFAPLAELYHFEGKSRGRDRRGQSRFELEIGFMRQRWGPLLDRDPFYSPKLSLRAVDFRLR
jgi:GT2 family glycosyltransferase